MLWGAWVPVWIKGHKLFEIIFNIYSTLVRITSQTHRLQFKYNNALKAHIFTLLSGSPLLHIYTQVAHIVVYVCYNKSIMYIIIKSSINIHSSQCPYPSMLKNKHINYISTSYPVLLCSLQVDPHLAIIHSFDFTLISCNLKWIRFGDFQEVIFV